MKPIQLRLRASLNPFFLNKQSNLFVVRSWIVPKGQPEPDQSFEKVAQLTAQWISDHVAG